MLAWWAHLILFTQCKRCSARHIRCTDRAPVGNMHSARTAERLSFLSQYSLHSKFPEPTNTTRFLNEQAKHFLATKFPEWPSTASPNDQVWRMNMDSIPSNQVSWIQLVPPSGPVAPPHDQLGFSRETLRSRRKPASRPSTSTASAAAGWPRRWTGIY